MKFLILYDNGVWVRDIVVSELLVVALGLDGPRRTARDKSIPGYQHCSTMQSGIYRMVPTLQHGISTAGCSVELERVELKI